MIGNTASTTSFDLDLSDPGDRRTPLRRGVVWLPFLNLEDVGIPGTRLCFGLGGRHHPFAARYCAYTIADFQLAGMGDVGSIRRLLLDGAVLLLDGEVLLLDGAVLLLNLERFSEENFRRDIFQMLPTANGEYRLIVEQCWKRVYFSLEGDPFPLTPGGRLPGRVRRVDELPPLPYYVHSGVRPRLRRGIVRLM